MVMDSAGRQESRWSAILSISSKIDCAPETLNEWVRKSEVDRGDRAGVTTGMAEKMTALEREKREMKQANEIPGKAPAYFAPSRRMFHSPACLQVSGFTYVATWRGFVHIAFVNDVLARRIVGWRVSRTAHAGFVLDALEQAVHQRQPGLGMAHHSDRGSQYLSIRHTERLADAGIEPSVSSVGDSYDNALAETVNGLFKAEVIHRRGPWRSFEAVRYVSLEWPNGV